MENKPRISKWIVRGYVLITLIMAILYTVLLSVISNAIMAEIIVSLVMVSVIILLCFIIYSLYKTKYAIKDGKLYSWSPFAVIDIKIKDIKNVEQTRVPFYFKGFGASVYSGRFYIPTVGWTRAIMTNMTDGVLIKTKDGRNYLITPSNPKSFVKLLK
jgi:hypothetical protein